VHIDLNENLIKPQSTEAGKIREKNKLPSQTRENTLDLIRFLEKPFTINSPPKEACEQLEALFELAVTSKVPLYFLEKLFKLQNGQITLTNALCSYRQRYIAIVNLAKVAASLFKQRGVEYVFFKTLRPFPSVGSDIDVLIFNEHLGKLPDYFRGESEVMDSCEDNLTLYFPSFDLKLDLHNSLSVSLFPYLDADSLRSEVVESFLDQTPVNVLSPEAEVVITACHSVFKEQMLTLQDCFMFRHLLPLCNRDKLQVLIQKNNVNAAFELSTNLAATAFKMAGTADFSSEDSGVLIQAAQYEFARFSSSGFIFPYKFSAYAFCICFAERALLNRLGQRGAANLTMHLFNRAFMKRLIARLPKHLQRTSY
jgi:hypothetical protein